MEALLIEEWLRGLDPIFVLDEASLAVVRDRVRAVAADSGAPPGVADRAALVATEIGQNQLRHARAGRIAVRAAARGEHRGIEVVGADRGRGIADLAGALDAPPRTTGSLGVGVGSIRRLSSEVDFGVRLGEGMRVAARIFDREAPRRREVGVYGRPIGDETINGDHGGWVRVGDALLVSVCDGLGHGPPAREAADKAMRVFHARAGEEPAAILDACHAALAGTRGVVMAIARIDEASSRMDLVSVGNIDVQVCAPRTARRFGGSSAVVGARGTALRSRTESVTLGPSDVVVMTTDGISSRLSIEQDHALLYAHPGAIAAQILERHGKPNDDALVLVTR